MEKILDLNMCVWDLAREVPEFLDIMASVGFEEMRHCAMENPKTKELTMPMAVMNHGQDVSMVIDAFKKAGFTVINE
ncbi:MAG: DUF1858 domain-containing protein [Lachnospiraceae bacterium]|nr:DUF1858 domain-containing protein [Lachnospiraceae bacterium]